MNKLLIVFGILILGTLPTFATAELETTVEPDAMIKNTKGFVGFNYNRQDLDEPGHQVIINDHSAFNININLFKKGALFTKEKVENE